MHQPEAYAVPDHVAPERVVDFDFFALAADDGDAQRAWWGVQQAHPDIFWTPRNGGHWVATRGEDIKAIQLDHERFSMTDSNIPKGRRPFPMPPIDQDPPAHFGYRSVITPAFLPKAVAAMEPGVRAVMRELVEELQPQGSCEFMSAVAKVLPINVFLHMVDLPESDAAILIPITEQVTGSSDPTVAAEGRKELARYLQDCIRARTADPGADLISRVVTAKIDGRPITEIEALGMSVLLLTGGLDTVASMLGFCTRFLAANPPQRRELAADPSRIPTALDELIRRHGIPNTARLITGDFDYKGVSFRQGEQVQIPNCLYGLDDRIVDRPLEVDFSRSSPLSHATFGNGPHRCPGAILARMELRVFLEEWLSRIPEFELDPARPPVARIGLTNSMRELHLVWR